MDVINISTVSSLRSLYNLERTTQEIEITYNWGHEFASRFNISFNFFNPSSRNITINKITIVENGHSFFSEREPALLAARKPKAAFSTSLPINVSPSTSVDTVCSFKDLDKQMHLKTYTLVFRINGADIVKTIDLGKNILTSDELAAHFENELF